MGFYLSLFLAILERQVKIDVSCSLNVTDCGEKSFAVSSIKRASERSVVQSLGKRHDWAVALELASNDRRAVTIFISPHGMGRWQQCEPTYGDRTSAAVCRSMGRTLHQLQTVAASRAVHPGIARRDRRPRVSAECRLYPTG
ncbi:MAG: hypothetical protein DWI02_07505 [Planctomycetota bacterium]|nr:MAG: hypothetical protein DWI02_07505 [Planctomycetota bacterium]